MHEVYEVCKYFGTPGLIGGTIGYLLLGTNVRGSDGNILAGEPWEFAWAFTAGGVVIGAAIWYIVFSVIA